MHCPHCSIPYDEAIAPGTCTRCGGALPRRALSSIPAHGPEGSERREATVLFCDLSGYTRWNEEEDPEEIALAMEVVRAEAARIIEDHGGIVNQFVGDEVMGLFGVLSSHDDDPRRALAAALRFHEYMRDRTAPGARRLHLHSGAETGLVYARVRDLRSGLFEITGEAVNTAARLRSLASGDEIVCGPELVRRVQDFYRLEPLEPFRLHSDAQPIVPQRVLGPTESSSFFEVAALKGLTRYVNREVELADLTRWWERTERGEGGLVKVGGEAGVGKTRFLHEFNARLGSDRWVLHGRCSPYRGVPPYQPFIDALRSFIDATPITRGESVQQLSDRWALSQASRLALRHLLAPDSEQTAQLKAGDLRSAIVDALREIMGSLASQHPLLVMIEDWQWADEASRSALRLITPHLDHLRVLVVVNFRSTELTQGEQPQTSRHIQLRPLGAKHTEAIARSVLGALRLPQGLSSFVHDRTLGNPFFVEEICRSLLDSGTCSVRDDSVMLVEPLFQVRAPSTVQAIVRARVDRLPEEQRDVLRMAAVIGPEFSPDLLEALTDGGRGEPLAAAGPGGLRLLAVLEALERHDLIHRDSTHTVAYRFKHAITREVVYESLPMRTRRAHHAQLARALELRTPADELERHFEALANHYRLGAQSAKAIEFAVRAGDKAWRAFALEQAGLQYRRAIADLDLLTNGDDAARSTHIDVSLSWAKVGIYNPHVDQIAALRDAYGFANDLQDRRRAALCLDWLCWIEYGLGNHVAACAYAQSFLRDAEALAEERLIATACLNVGRCHMVYADYDSALATLERGLALLTRAQAAAQSFGLSNCAMVLADRGAFAQAQAYLDQSISAARGQQSLLGPVLVLQAMVEGWQGRWDRALATSARVLDIAQRIEGTYILGMSRLIAGFARFMTSGERAGLSEAREGIDQLERQEIRLHMSYNWSLLASGLARVGDYDQAQLAADLALARTSALDRQGECEALRVLALVACRRDHDIPAAEGHLQRAVRAAEAKRSERDWVMCELTRAHLSEAAGDAERARTTLAGARARAEQLGLVLCD